MDNSSLKIDNTLDKNFRLFKQNDQFRYLYGIDEYCLGIWKNTNLSINDITTSILPVGFNINGCIFIYNENVYEDFDGLIEAEIEKLREFSFINKDKFFFLVLKDVLYLDDFETMVFEKQLLYSFNSKSSEENFDIKFNDFLHELKLNYFFFNTVINVSFNKDGKSLKVIQTDNKYSFFLNDSNFFIDDIAALDESKNQHLKHFLLKFDPKKEIKVKSPIFISV